MLYRSSVLTGVGLDGLGTNLGLGNLAMGYPHSFILGLANQGQEGGTCLDIIVVNCFFLYTTRSAKKRMIHLIVRLLLGESY